MLNVYFVSKAVFYCSFVLCSAASSMNIVNWIVILPGVNCLEYLQWNVCH